MGVLVVVAADGNVFMTSAWTVQMSGEGRVGVVIGNGVAWQGPRWVFLCQTGLAAMGFSAELRERLKTEGFDPVKARWSWQDGAVLVGSGSRVVS